MKNKFKLLIEEISQRSSEVHYTNLEALFGILESGYIFPFTYPVSSEIRNTPWEVPSKREIAVLRRSIDRYINSLSGNKKTRAIESLTSNASGVKIYLFTSNILSKLRGVSKKPISEYGKNYLESFNNNYDNLYARIAQRSKVDYHKLRKDLMDLGKKLGYKGKADTSFQNEDYTKEIDKLIKKHNINTKGLEITSIYNEISFTIHRIIILYSNKGKFREGEERLVFKDKKTRGIPITSEFVKIRITKDFTPEDMYQLTTEDITPEGRIKKFSKFKEELIRNKDAFMAEKNYYNLIDSLEKAIKTEENRLKNQEK